MPRTRALAGAFLAAITFAATQFLVPVPARAAALPVPARDPFYSYSGPTPLSRVPPGAVLKKRPVVVELGGIGTPLDGEQLLYRTTGQLDQPTVTVTTVLRPTSKTTVPRIIGYLSFYDGLASQCDPSYWLRGGDPGSSIQSQAEEEELLIGWYLANGFTVTVPDFEGTHLDWMAGHESGYGTLDAIRATETSLRIGPATPVGLSGYSGGAVAADWSSELAPAYAPRLHLVGVAEGGIPADYAHIFGYINGTALYSAAIPGILLGLARAYHVNLDPYLSAYGMKAVHAESTGCIASYFGNYPGLTVARIMKPKYANLLSVPVLRRMLNDQVMGSGPRHPREFLFMGVGDVDGTGDGVMIDHDIEALAAKYCSEGVPVDLQIYQGANHEDAGALFEPQTADFFQAVFAGAPFTSTCSS